MKNKNMVLIALALGCGLVAAFLTTKLGAGSKNDMVPVLVAAKNIDQGTKLDKVEEMFVMKPFPKESVPPEHIDDIAQLKGKILQRTIRQGSHCTIADVTPRDGIELPIDEKTGRKYKAMAVKVSAETNVSGLVQPGSRVNVIHSRKLQNGGAVAKIILQNVLVVSVDSNTVRKEEENFNKNAQTVTLALKDKETVELTKAVKSGEVTLSLRSPDDTTINPNLDSSSDSEESPSEKSKILVAKESIPAGTKLADPGKYFDQIDWPGKAPENFITKIEDLKDKSIHKAIAKMTPPTQEALIQEKVPQAAAKPAPVDNAERHTMTIQVGGREPYYHHYRNGVLEKVTNSPTAQAPQVKPGEKADKVASPKGENSDPKNQDSSKAG